MICDNCIKRDECTKIISTNETRCLSKVKEYTSRDSISFLLDSVKAISASTGMDYQEVEKLIRAFEIQFERDVSETNIHGDIMYSRWR